MDGLTAGRIVHFVTEEGIHLPSIVVKVWDKDSGVVNLSVFIDHSEYTGDAIWPRTSVPYSETPMPNTWHWIEKA
jgi:hypothetical protein